MNRAQGYCDSQKTRQLDKELTEYDAKLATITAEINSIEDDDSDENKAAKRLIELRGKIELLQKRRAKHAAALIESEKADAAANLADAKAKHKAATEAFVKARTEYTERIKREYRWPQAGDLLLHENWPRSLTALHVARSEASDAVIKADSWLRAVDPAKAIPGIKYSIVGPGKITSQKTVA